MVRAFQRCGLALYRRQFQLFFKPPEESAEEVVKVLCFLFQASPAKISFENGKPSTEANSY